MPLNIPRKRVRDPSPPIEHRKKTGKANAANATSTANAATTTPFRKTSFLDELDPGFTPRSSTHNGSSTHVLDDSQDDESSLTSLSDVELEDVPPAKRQKSAPSFHEEEDSHDEDEDIEFEDVVGIQAPQSAVPDTPATSGDLELTLTRDTRISLANALGKKGPSKLERTIRIATHRVHVQCLLWHNAVRNSWLCDPEVHGILLSHIPPRIEYQVDRWMRNCGLELPNETPRSKTSNRERTKSGGKGRQHRDWGDAAQRLERGVVNMSHGDPALQLLKELKSWWKQRFQVTAPGLRKRGYMTLERLDRLTKAFKQDEHDPEKFGERIRNFDDFRKCAQECAGSRDVGAQLFTALLRALGLEARLVASLQPLGFGWNKLEDADPEKEPAWLDQSPKNTAGKKDAAKRAAVPASETAAVPPPTAVLRCSTRRTRSAKITCQEAEDSEGSDLLPDKDSDNDELVIEPMQPLPQRGKAYDTELLFPHYWTEVLSPATKKYIPVEPIVKSIVAPTRELVESLEPRGGKADKARQIMAYVIAFSQDGTAKDVTVRYLKRQMLPGRTKGVRLPAEDIPVYDRSGKLKRYETSDWFKTVMKGYVRGDKDHPITETDHLEDSTDLKPAKAEKKEVKEGAETLQYYKQSTEFVLERHLKREDALLPGAKPVKMFRNKGKSAHAQDEPVYLRKDVVQVKSAETWHRQGRAPKEGEAPLKLVPHRAATTNRRREIAEMEAATGSKVQQALYSFDQTDWIIPPPIRNGVIPKNEYGNIDLFVETMCPKGAVHVPYRGGMRVCKRLGIDYAEAVIDFEFGHRMAVPVIQGVVIAEEYHDQVMEELAKDEEERVRKEDEKRRKAALAMWRKFMMGMRIVERIKRDYGHMRDDVEVFGRSGRAGGEEEADAADQGAGGDNMGGGFFPEGYEDDESDGGETAQLTSGFFPVVDADQEEGEDTLEVDHGEDLRRGR